MSSAGTSSRAPSSAQQQLVYTPPSSLNSLLAGAVAGAVEATVTYPTEYVKTQLQLAVRATPTDKPPTALNIVRSTVRDRGISGLYRGVGALVTGTAAKAGVRFLTYENAKHMLTPHNADKSADGRVKLSLPRLVAAGAISGAIEGLAVVTPTETIKTKLIHDSSQPQPRFKGMVHGARVILSEEGIGGIYRGASSVVARQMANSAVRLSTYTALRERSARWFGAENPADLGVAISFLNGAIAGIVTVYATMPIDVVKTRMQSLDASRLYTSALDCFTKVIRQEGVPALWRGTTPRLARLIFSGGIVFSVYETVSKALLPFI